MTITVNQPEKVHAVEGQKLEFKTSAFYAPGEHNPGFKQMRTIAETVAAFMNADGGVLLIGVADDGTVVGFEKDLDVLGFQPSSVALRLPQMDDSTFTYEASPDKYQLKLRNVLKAFLGPNHMKYLGEIKFSKVPTMPSKALSSKVCCLVEVKKCDEDDFVYCSEKYSANSPVIDEIFLRSGNQKRKLQGAERDVFVRGRVAAGFDAQIKAVRAAVAATGGGTNYAAVMDSVHELLERLDRQRLVGAEVVVTGAQPLDEEHLKPMGKPKGVVFDGAHLCDVKSWKDVFRAIYCKLNDLSPASFDSLPNDEPKWFKRAKRCTGCYQEKFGTAHDVRAVELSTKAYLWNEGYFLRKLMSACGVDASRFMVRA